MLQAIQKSVKKSQSFAFETTLSGTVYAIKIIQWQAQGYTVILYYFSLPSVEIAINRVKHRVAQGGHHIPEHDIRRRYKRSLENLEKCYKPIVDEWVTVNTSSSQPILIQRSHNDASI